MFEILIFFGVAGSIKILLYCISSYLWRFNYLWIFLSFGLDYKGWIGGESLKLREDSPDKIKRVNSIINSIKGILLDLDPDSALLFLDWMLKK